MSKNLSDIFPPTEIGGGGGGIEEAPLTGKMYARQSGAWSEFATGNLDDGNQDGEILTWDTAEANWTHDDTMIVKGGHVGIGTSDPSDYWIQAQDLVVAGSSNEGITIATTAPTGNTRLAFAGTTTGNPGLDNGGSISYNHGTDTLSVRVNGLDPLTIDATGTATFSGTVNATGVTSNNLFINSPAGTIGIDGGSRFEVFEASFGNNRRMAFHAAGLGDPFVIDGSGDAYFSGTVNAGTMVIRDRRIYDTTTCGAIWIDDSMQPVNSSGTRTTDAQDLGASGYRFKDAHFSGTVSALRGIFTSSNADNVVQAVGQSAQSSIRPNGTFYRHNVAGINFGNTGLLPVNTTGAADASFGYDIGTSTYKWKDAHFSGTVSAGDTKIMDKGKLVHSGFAGVQINVNKQFIATNGSGSAMNTPEADIGSTTYKWKDAHFSGTVNASFLTAVNVYRPLTDACGIQFDVTAVVPTDNSGSRQNNLVDFGSTTYKWKDAHFAGTVNAAETYLRGDTGARTAWEKTGHYGWSAGIDNSSFFYINGGGATDALRIEPNSNVATFSGTVSAASFTDLNGDPIGGGGLPSGDWHCTGSITAEGNVTAYALSDERLKDDIAPMPLGLIDGINPVTFKWKDSGKASGGVIAQQLQACGLDDWVNVAPNGDLGVDYNALVGVLLAEVLELKARVKEMESANTHS